MKRTREDLDILGHCQFEPSEFDEMGHFVSKVEHHAQTADFSTQLAQ